MRCLTIFGLLAVGLLLALPLVRTRAQDPAASNASPAPAAIEAEEDVAAGGQAAPGEPAEASSQLPVTGIVTSLTIFVLAIFVGFEVITKVPPTLHTPLMSGSNAISGITIVGALLVAGAAVGSEPTAGAYVGFYVGLLAVVLATVNVVGGFLVTHRMLSMFQRKKK